MNEILEAALDYAARGEPVFPLAPGGKMPLIPRAHRPGDSCRGECDRDGHGLYDATTEAARITAWWRRTPGANIGIRTGITRDVLDVDTKHVDGHASLGRLQGSEDWSGVPAVRTPTGGLHLSVAPTGFGNKAGFAPGLDWRGKGGYVVAPPSVTPTGAYRWLTEDAAVSPCPLWLLAALSPAPEVTPTILRRRLVVLPGGRYASAAVRSETDRVRTAALGARNDTLNRSAFALGTLVGAGVLDAGIAARALLDAALDSGLGEEESRKTILSGLNSGAAKPRHGVSA